MRSKSAAVLDVSSQTVTAIVGKRGVNGTFIVQNQFKSPYDGYAEGEIIDIQSFISAVKEVVSGVLNSASGIKSFYVGVPGEFLRLVNADKVLSFPAAKKISGADCRALAERAAPPDSEKWQTIRHSCLYYVLSDKRRVIDPVNCLSDSVQGKFCFFQCKNSFIGCLMDAFKSFKSIVSVNLIPTPLAEALYLIDPERRDECAVLFDFGAISSTYSVICGNGLLYSESFSLGIGHLAVFLMEELDIPYDVAMHFLTSVNLNAKDRLSSKADCEYEGQIYEFALPGLRLKIRECLDGICETIEECSRSYPLKNQDGKPLYITGEGALAVRGAVEHISGRLVKSVEVAAPKLPYYDNPKYSSLFSLLDMALSDGD